MNLRLPHLRSHKIPLFILLFLCFASAILGDSTAEALLLAHFGASMVPKMYLFNALFLFLFSAFAMTIIDRVDRGLFFFVLALGHSVVLFCVWLGVHLGATFLYVPLFPYAYVSKILLFLMFWTLANDLIDSRRAGSEFPFIAAGGTLGAIAVSFLIPWLMRVLTADSLLAIWCGLSIVLALYFLPIWKSFDRQFQTGSDKQKHTVRTFKSFAGDLKLLRDEPLLSNMSIIYFLLFFIVLNQQYGFYSAIKSRYTNAESLASFLGYFNGVSMAATFLLQLTLAGFVLRKIGSTRSMFLLPAILCIVFGSLCLAGFTHGGATAAGSSLLFWGVVLGLSLRIAFFDSFFSPNFQVFFSSLPQDIRGRGKLSIEGAIKPLAIASASVWLMSVAGKLPLSTNMLVLFVLAAAMVGVVFRLRRRYTESLTRYLAGFEAHKISRFMNALDLAHSDNIIAGLAGLLEKEAFEVKSYIVEILAEINSTDSVHVLTDYLARADEKMRSRIAVALGKLKRPDLRPFFSSLLRDTDSRVVADAVLALSGFRDAEVNEGLGAFLGHPHRRVRANTVITMWTTATQGQRSSLAAVLGQLLASDDVLDRSAGIFALGETRSIETAVPMLEVFYQENRQQILSIKRVWRHFLTALAKNVCDRSVDLLLAVSDAWYASRRDEVSAAIASLLCDGYPVEGLLGRLSADDILLRHMCVKALYLACGEKPLALPQSIDERLVGLAEQEHEALQRDRHSFGVLEGGGEGRDVFLLMHALREQCIEGRLRCLIQIAAMLDRSGQVRKIVGRLFHENRHMRARAIEVLDNAGNMRVNRRIMALLDTSDGAHAHAHEADANAGPRTAAEVISRYEQCRYPWVALCARHARQKTAA